MADQAKFQQAMKEAAAAAWEQDWSRAVDAYTAAVRTNPADVQALAGLALALMETGHNPEALQVYERVSKLAPNDPLPHEKVAQLYERMGRRQDAAQKYLAVGELYFARRDMDRAVPNWSQAASLNMDLAQAHSRLATYLESNDKTHDQAVYAYLNLARNLQQIGQATRAEQALLRAQTLSPINADVRQALQVLKAGQKIERVDSPTYPPGQDGTRIQDPFDFSEEFEDEEEHLSPIDEAARDALAELADMIFSGEVSGNAQEPLFQAIEAHQIGDAEAAVDYYLQAQKARFDHPALSVSLGMLQSHLGDKSGALKTLAKLNVTTGPYAIGVNLAVGDLELEAGHVEPAMNRLITALQNADETLNTGQIDAVGYDRFRDSWKESSGEQQQEMAHGIALFLRDARWRAKLSDALSGYAAHDKISYVSDLIEMMSEGGRPEIAEIMDRIDTYITRSMLLMAKEETHYAIEKAPDYLPVHTRLADILINEGRMKEAADKINLVATAYQMRGKPDKAADLFARVIDIWPADESARLKVIEMLRDQGRSVEAMRQYADLGDLYHRMMMDTDRALSTYDEALIYARRNQVDAQHVVPVLKAMADIEAQRLNWQKALAYYERVNQAAPDDTEAARQMIDLNFQMGDSAGAIKALDRFLRYCITNGQGERVLETLEQQVRRHPDEIGLRQRLADVYLQQKRQGEAIGQLDALGELFLEAGRLDEARNTIRKIVELNPPDVDGYNQLLQQLESSG